MRHKNKGRKFNRTKAQREAFIKGLVRALAINDQITTTSARAKELSGYVERLLTKVQKSAPVAVDRSLAKDYDRAVAKKLKTLSGQYAGGGGYTQVIKTAPRRSDGAAMAVIRFISKKKA